MSTLSAVQWVMRRLKKNSNLPEKAMRGAGGNYGVMVEAEIKSAIAEGRLIRGGVKERARGCSYDMAVGTIFWGGKIITRDAGGPPQQVVVPPGGIIGLFTIEELDLPDDVCATAFAMNVMSSRGFLVLNSGHIDPGFKGPLTVKALNIRKTDIAIHQDEPIFTIVFQKLSVPTTPYGVNKERCVREREFNARTVETAPRALSDLIAADRDGAFPSRGEIDSLIRKHWMSRWTTMLTILAVAFSGVAAVASFLQLRSAPTSTVIAAAPAPIQIALEETLEEKSGSKQVGPESSVKRAQSIPHERSDSEKQTEDLSRDR